MSVAWQYSDIEIGSSGGNEWWVCGRGEIVVFSPLMTSPADQWQRLSERKISTIKVLARIRDCLSEVGRRESLREIASAEDTY